MGWKDGTPVKEGAASSAWQQGTPVTDAPSRKSAPGGRGRGGLIEKADAFMRGAADSLSFGFADEAAAAANTILPLDKGSVSGFSGGFSNAYGRNLALQRDRDRYDGENSKAVRISGQVGGALVPAFGAARAAVGATTAARTLGRGAASGAGMGAVGGFGAGEGGFRNRAESAAGGAVVGGALGTAGGAAVELAPRVANLFRQYTMRLPRAEAVAQTLRALQRDGLTLTQAQAAIDRYATMGKPAVLGDLGANLRARAGVAARSPGRSQVLAREVLDRRQAGQAERLTRDIRQTVSPRVDVRAADDELLQQARAQAGPLYDEAYAAPGVSSPEIDQMLATPAGRAALQKAHTIAANEGRDPTSLGFDLDEAGEVVLTRVPSPETLDLVKRGFDDLLEPSRNPVTGRLDLDAGGNAINGLKNRFLGEVDRLNPAYAQARGAYAGPAQARDALANGRRFGQLDPEDIAAQQARGSQNAQDMFRVGAARALTDTVNKSNPRGIRAAGIASTPQQLAQLRAMGANADELARRTAAERELAQLNGELQGSQTDIRRLASQDSEGAALPDSLPNSTLLGWAARGLGSLARAGRGRRIEAVNDAAGPLLFGDAPGDLQRALQAMAQAEQLGLLQGRTRARVATGAGGGLGLLSSGTLAIRDDR